MSDLFKDLTPIKNDAPASSPTPDASQNVNSVTTKPAEKPSELQGTQTPEPVLTAPVAPVIPPQAPVGEKAITEALGEIKAEQNEPENEKPDELTMLKGRASMMGIVFSNNIGLDALKQKIDEKMNPPAPKEPEVIEPEVKVNAPMISQDGQSNVTGPMKMRQNAMAKAMALVRCRITNLDPKKKDLNGEILTVANEIIGTVRKYIPYGEFTDNGYHIPQCLYDNLKEREFWNITSRKNNQGRIIDTSKYAREFAIEVLEPLTEKEIEQLAAAQRASAGAE